MRRKRPAAWLALLIATALVANPALVFAAKGPKGPSKAEAKARLERVKEKQLRHITQDEREAAADRFAQKQLAVPQSVKTSALATPGPGGIPDMFGTTPNWAFSPPLRKFVDGLPGLDPAGKNNLGQYLPVGKPDTKTYPGSDYYEIELVEYEEQMHSDLPPTRLRGYRQTNAGTDAQGNNTLQPGPVHYLGPLIQATKDRPVRIKFTNKLPTGQGGKLFIPVDKSVMGAGMGPLMHNVPNMDQMYYTENRATLHLHGGRTPWISDGTAHQWITPAGEQTPYPKGVSVKNVPDMPDPGDGSMTFFYTNQQSARMMFYHDHSYGITRLNVYAGEAAGYMITDDVEKQLVADKVIPADQIPLIIQDKTFVDPSTITTTDPTWNWGTTPGTPHKGDLWLPHVYVPAQNPADPGGMNPTGRWHYGPWFWPPTKNISHPPTSNPYYDPVNAPWEPPLMPATPNPSMGMEAFFDTPVVNGTAFPTMTVEPKSYRFRILNAANDRFWNLQMYEADTSTVSSDNRRLTEVKMVPASTTATNFPEGWPTDGRDGGVPDPDTKGPEWIQIGTEGGFLPKPAVLPQQPITWNLDPTTFNMGNVDLHSLLLGPAERADVIVDFSKYAGKTLILYNDAPAAFPARDPRVDYYTGAPDLTDTGGHTGPKVGFGPNTRTIMQIHVADNPPATAFNVDDLTAKWLPNGTTEGVFQRGQDPILVGQKAYDSVYATTFPSTYPNWGASSIGDNELTFKTATGEMLTWKMEPKAIQDEMGEAFDKEYGRMSGNLGLEMPNTVAGGQNFVLYGYMDPPTENVKASMTPLTPKAGDGTQIWKITHNGVDTHPIHFHLFDVQLVNRVGWDNAIRWPDENELGWKDTVRVSPLEDTIVALRPVVPKAPFGSPDSIRPLDPTMPLGSTMGFQNLDPITHQQIVPPVSNQLFNFGWEYMWHCHILSHEEMDMMRPISVGVDRKLPAKPVAGAVKDATGSTLTWTDGTPALPAYPAAGNKWGDPTGEIGFRVERAPVVNGVVGTYTTIANVLANVTTCRDNTAGTFAYRIVAYNAAGSVTSSPTLGKATRVFGATRYETAVAAAKDAFTNWGGVNDIVLASGADPLVDALSASGLSKAYNAPVLLVPPTSLPTVVSDAIRDAGAVGNVKLHLVGNTLDAATRAKLLAIPGVDPALDVVAGADRYATSQAVAMRMRTVMGPRQAVFFVNGENSATFTDAAVGSALAAAKGFPLLLVGANVVPANTLSTVTNVGATERYIIGSASVVTEDNRNRLGVATANRWSGADRYSTATTVANKAAAKAWLTKTSVGIATSVSDAISGGAATGAKGGPLLLTAPTTLPTPTRDYLVTNKAVITDAKVYGSSTAISDAVLTAINTALQ